MKKIKFEKNFSLNKETITRLNDNQLANVKGGATFTLFCQSRKNDCPTMLTCGGSCLPPSADCITTGCGTI